MSQKRIADGLKVFCILTAVGGMAYMALLAKVMRESYYLVAGTDTIIGWPAVALISATTTLCFLLLYLFWKVCTQIGHDNSFSAANRDSFKAMSMLLVLLAAIWLGFTIIYLIMGNKIDMSVFKVIKLFQIIVIWVAGAYLTGALSKLIEKAREIREENDLTI